MRNRSIDKILLSVEKPARYIGNEYNAVHKNLDSVEVRFAFAFPDVYDIGMSHLGIRILYDILNKRDDTFCERVFAPWVDMEQEMRRYEIPLFALESGDNIADFDMLGFTLQYEMSYTNVLNMLDLAGIPIWSKERTNHHPFVLAGGPCAYNPEPLADIIDFFLIGDGEEAINEIVDCYKTWKHSGDTDRQNLLKHVASIEGVYVPSLYEVSYNDDGTINAIVPKIDSLPHIISKRVVTDLSGAAYPERPIVPYIDIVHDRAVLEIFRGCTRGCRFCQAGMIYRPIRERSADSLLELADKLIRATGYSEMSLSSLSTGDYSQLEQLVKILLERFQDEKVALSLPSLRLDSVDKSLLERIQSVKKTGLTFAPEAGTQRLRDVINKGITDDDILRTVKYAFRQGWQSVKLYFMIGLPTETDDDLYGIAEMARRILDVYYSIPKEQRGRHIDITVSTSSFVPKPFTPFQWDPQDKIDRLSYKQHLLQQQLRMKHVTYHWSDNRLSFMEAVFARGDRRLGRVLAAALANGCRFDAWTDYFNYEGWLKAFEQCGIDPEFYAGRIRSYDEVLPWDHIDAGVSKDFLIRERERALKGKTTFDCRRACIKCGMERWEGVCGNANVDTL
ncbi:MAG: hypothetical protein PWQ93_1824 [Clostridiales bacterium]|nr:hypothetical protein [Clostridiales bacterium]